MTDDPMIEKAHLLIVEWARFMRSNAAEIWQDVGYPPATPVGMQAVTNYAVAEDDAANYYALFDAAQVRVVDTVMDDLRELVPWAAWAIFRRHKLGSSGFVEYEERFKKNELPAGMYVAALEELCPALVSRGLL